jgi:hypothetical protein
MHPALATASSIAQAYTLCRALLIALPYLLLLLLFTAMTAEGLLEM